MNTFKLGDKVAWTSQGRGSMKEKVGTVVFLEHDTLTPLRAHMLHFPGHQRMYDGLSWAGPLVEITDGSKRPKLYMPRERLLRRVDDVQNTTPPSRD